MTLTKREEFAKAAMQSLINAMDFPWNGDDDDPNENTTQLIRDSIPTITQMSVHYADALIAELEKSEVKKECNHREFDSFKIYDPTRIEGHTMRSICRRCSHTWIIK